MKFIKQIWYFLYPPNDWVVVWSIKGNWYWHSKPNINAGNVFYIIEFSKHRDKFRLKCDGEDTKLHQLRKTALDKLAEYNNNLLQIQFNSKNKIK